MPIQTGRGRRPTQRPTRAHTPESSLASEPYWGTKGQNRRRPKITSTAGSRVSMATTAQTMPMAPTGPRLR